MRVAVSGTGRIGRLFLRKALTMVSGSLEVAVINSTTPPATLSHLLQYDSVHGKWAAEVHADDKGLIVNGRHIPVISERNPEKLPWASYGIDLVVDATGKFNDRAGAEKHMAAGAKRVLVTAPGKGADATIVMGVNEESYDPDKHTFVSTASCTTNCLAPVLSVLDTDFGVKQGWMTTVHAYTSDQNHLDNPHKDLRRARSCASSIIPTSTGVGKALKEVLPHLAHAIDGVSLRVPTPNVSLIDLTVQLSREATADEVRESFRIKSRGKMGSVLGYTELPLVSSDYIGDDKSAIVDGLSVISRGDQVKLMAWYDNEWAYASRVYDFICYAHAVEKSATPVG
ncbi:type I glyceraldehyde-3-phosphate dehydrogenase [Paenibacillus arenosi]|uniref:Glyceraldehyde-3-phosphate dehydrogenase n=1 Tax=Paenibacillus arenosi TaxID=2774142 RepID=A0ABR9AXP5_9BACL|nr:type I glyceraldehyde-3-phosphate dehydrogenase [Paenibacillus arenosi]MBD8497960.1 type I glyceraldehyde-3-phosphate dehydrogenase [Paenibacillus arenosi]